MLKPCGGHPAPLIFGIGCASYAGEKPPVDTDDMNPDFPERFWQLWDDVGGLFDYSVGKLMSMTGVALPHYIPLLQGHQLHPSRALDAKVVAVPLSHILITRRGGGYGVKYSSAQALRAAYRLGADTRVILIGVDEDVHLERFWQNHRRHNTCHELAELGLEVTIPNYSFFTCAPRFQILRNRKRILLVSERLSQAGVRVSLHLNANTPGDWSFWTDFLREHSEVKTVTIEFQTGALVDQEFAQATLNALDVLLDGVGRPIHFLMVGAARFYSHAQERQWKFTIIDSVPFMWTKSRKLSQRSSAGSFSLRHYPTNAGAPLHELFEANVAAYRESLKAGTETPLAPASEDPNQGSLLC